MDRLNSRNATIQLAKHALSSCFIFKNININIYQDYNLSVVLYVCKTWFLTLRKEHRLKG